MAICHEVGLAGDKNETENDAQKTEETEEGYDIFILCNQDDKVAFSKSTEIMKFLRRRCGLNVTLNLEAIKYGAPELPILKHLEKSKNVIIFAGKSEKEDRLFDFLLQQVLHENIKILLVLEDKDINIHGYISYFKSRCNSLILKAGQDEDMQTVCWMKELLFKLAGIQK